MKKLSILGVVFLVAGCSHSSGDPASAPVKVELTDQKTIAITSIKDSVLIKGVAVNRGNCPYLDANNIESSRFLLLIAGIWSSGQILDRMNPQERSDFMSKSDDGARSVFMQAMEQKYLDRNDPRYSVIDNPPLPAFPQNIAFGSGIELQSLCNKVLEVRVDTDQGSWTFSWK